MAAAGRLSLWSSFTVIGTLMAITRTATAAIRIRRRFRPAALGSASAGSTGVARPTASG